MTEYKIGDEVEVGGIVFTKIGDWPFRLGTAPQPCPNDPRCPHTAAVHDVYDAEDESPQCCMDDCDCGHRGLLHE